MRERHSDIPASKLSDSTLKVAKDSLRDKGDIVHERGAWMSLSQKARDGIESWKENEVSFAVLGLAESYSFTLTKLDIDHRNPKRRMIKMLSHATSKMESTLKPSSRKPNQSRNELLTPHLTNQPLNQPRRERRDIKRVKMKTQRMEAIRKEDRTKERGKGNELRKGKVVDLRRNLK